MLLTEESTLIQVVRDIVSFGHPDLAQECRRDCLNRAGMEAFLGVKKMSDGRGVGRVLIVTRPSWMRVLARALEMDLHMLLMFHHRHQTVSSARFRALAHTADITGLGVVSTRI
jgi:hypothetical protein